MRGKTLIAITDARQAGISNADYPFFDTSMKHSDEHFPCLFHRTGMFGIPRLIVPLVQWFLKWSMPTAFRNRFQFLHEDNIVSFLRRGSPTRGAWREIAFEGSSGPDSITSEKCKRPRKRLGTGCG